MFAGWTRRLDPVTGNAILKAYGAFALKSGKAMKEELHEVLKQALFDLTAAELRALLYEPGNS